MQYRDSVLPILRGLRPRLMENWGKSPVVNNKGGGAADVVTALDIEVEKTTREALAKIYPDITFVGEENGGDRSAARFWIMDPIDGTAHYVRGLPFCTSMIALIEDGRVNFAAIYDFVGDNVYWAERGAGAFCNDTRLHVSDRDLGSAYFAWETHIEKPDNYERLMKFRHNQIVLLKTVTAGWEFAMVAAGKIEGRICFDPHGQDYDYAPGTLLVEEAGGVVANLGATTYDYRNLDFIASNPIIYKKLTSGPNALFPIQ